MDQYFSEWFFTLSEEDIGHWVLVKQSLQLIEAMKDERSEI